MSGLQQNEQLLLIGRTVLGLPLVLWGLSRGLSALDGLDILGFLIAAGLIIIGGNLLAGPLAHLIAGSAGKVYEPGERLKRPAPIYSVAESRRKAGEPEAALEAFRGLLKEHPHELRAWLEMIDILMSDLRSRERAERVYQEALESLPLAEQRAELDRGYESKRTRYFRSSEVVVPLPIPDDVTFDDSGLPVRNPRE